MRKLLELGGEKDEFFLHSFFKQQRFISWFSRYLFKISTLTTRTRISSTYANNYNGRSWADLFVYIKTSQVWTMAVVHDKLSKSQSCKIFRKFTRLSWLSGHLDLCLEKQGDLHAAKLLNLFVDQVTFGRFQSGLRLVKTTSISVWLFALLPVMIF